MRKEFDPYMTAIIANRIDGVIREMTNTLLRAARSAVINAARDFSCSICTGNDELLASAEGLPVHIFGSHLQTAAMREAHGDDVREGDCYLHNDPYTGNTHAADHTFMAPVFFEGEHLFTAIAKAHQADTGNALPTTYMAGAIDQYAEGTLIFPAVRVQRDYAMIDDVVRMCRSRIRVPDQWHGDFLAGIGAARIGERRLKELCEKYGKDTIKAFMRDWLDYSEERMIQEIRKLPKARVRNTGAHDPFGDILPDGIPISVTIDIDPDAALIELDLTENIENTDTGFNLSIACATSSSIAGVFNSLDPTIPRNAGSFRRVRHRLREGSAVGIPRFPHSCSVATTNVADRLVNMVQSGFAKLGDGYGLAEGGVGMGGGFANISGKDHRYGDAPYVNQLYVSSNGGPAGPRTDGWLTHSLPVAAGLMFKDSVEIDELKHPVEFTRLAVIPGSCGAGRQRGAPAIASGFTPKKHPVNILWPCDGTVFAPAGVHGGLPGARCRHVKIGRDGEETVLPTVVEDVLLFGERLAGNQCAGGGYGDPATRDPQKVLDDVLENFETVERARDVYLVVFEGSLDDDTLAVDLDATAELRARRAGDGRGAEPPGA